MASEAAKSLRSRADARSARANFTTPSIACVKSVELPAAKWESNGSQPNISRAPRISLAFLVIAAESASVIA